MKIKSPECKNEKLWQEILPEINRRLELSKMDNRLILDDFIRAINYFTDRGISEEEIIKRINPEKMSGFYAHQSKVWYPLDCGAKIYPVVMKRNQQVLFRISCTLKEEVVPEILQLALTFTIKRFPSFATTLKKGFFWHYMEACKRRYQVEEERGLPCQNFQLAKSLSPEFRVLYYGKRISVEFFHSITDGEGGLIFVKTLAAEYLRILGHDIAFGDGVWDIAETPRAEETRNDYHKIKDCKDAGGFMSKPAVQMSGKISKITPCQIISFDLPTDKLKEVTKGYGVTVTTYILSLMLLAGKAATEANKGRFYIQVPVDARKYFGSRSVRNFSFYCSVGTELNNIKDLEQLLPLVAGQLREGTSQHHMEVMMNSSINLLNVLTPIPLVVKTPIGQALFGYLSDAVFSSSLSNLGVISLPEEMGKYIEKFEFVLGGNSICRCSCSLATFGNHTVFDISKMTPDPSFEENMYRLLGKDGLVPRVSGSPLYED